MDVAEPIHRYCRVWNASAWATDPTYTDPSVHAASAEEPPNHITAVRARRPGACVLRTSTVDNHHAVARFSWHVVNADGTALPEGIDIAFISSDGSRIERIIEFFGPLARAPK
jgi:hypothetical protein